MSDNVAMKKSNSTKVTMALIDVIRLMRVNGLALVCFNRLGYTNMEGYKKHLKESLGFSLVGDLSDDEINSIASTLAEHAQAPDSDFSNLTRNIDQAFVDNSCIRELRAREKDYMVEINDLKQKVEMLEVEASPFKSILKMLAKRLKYREFERIKKELNYDK